MGSTSRKTVLRSRTLVPTRAVQNLVTNGKIPELRFRVPKVDGDFCFSEASMTRNAPL